MALRDSKYPFNCEVCGKKRMVSYCQRWNLLKGYSKNVCHSCGNKFARKSAFKKGVSSWNTGLNVSGMSGKRQTEKQKQTRSLLNKIDPVALKPGVVEKMKAAKVGKYGELSNGWRGGIAPINNLIRKRRDYKTWRQRVLERDNYSCRECGKNNCQLHVHHIRPFAKFKEYRTDISNGITLCPPCHKDIHLNKEIR